jgi:hypothetical protein
MVDKTMNRVLGAKKKLKHYIGRSGLSASSRRGKELTSEPWRERMDRYNVQY